MIQSPSTAETPRETMARPRRTEPPDGYIDIIEAAHRLGLSRRQLNTLTRESRLPGVVILEISAKTIFYEEQSIEHYIASRRRTL